LEGAKLHIPTILLDYSYGKIKGDYRYRFLYDTKNYDLGHKITKKDYSRNNEILKEIVLSLFSDYDIHAEKTYQYYLSNHSIEVVMEKFLSKISQSELTYNMIDKSFLEQGALRKFYNKIRKFEHGPI
jgi:hypothetical protein